MTAAAFFAAEGGAFRSLDLARSYWNPEALSGRAVVGLLGHELERRHGSEDCLPARLTVDMFRLAPYGTSTVESRVVKDGRRLRLVEADLVVEGERVARATCQFVQRATAPIGRVWAPGPWTAPHPDGLADETEKKGPSRAFDARWVTGSLWGNAEKACWIRERFDFVQGRALSPFSRVAVAADFASPFTNAGDGGIRYMNTDITIHLHRLPVGDWIGFEATGHEASQGIAVGHCRLHDPEGAIGFVTCTALANTRRSPA